MIGKCPWVDGVFWCGLGRGEGREGGGERAGGETGRKGMKKEGRGGRVKGGKKKGRERKSEDNVCISYGTGSNATISAALISSACSQFLHFCGNYGGVQESGSGIWEQLYHVSTYMYMESRK